ncbi:hypothetical protein V1L54_00490 [Streptomyces sp. TRM 70361]|uniref:hypothetical protein n=1 Tax=Streptomyces sp. TRM 70361 TaxID=3116553 RepID=UPI002E7BF6CA|nr:hypothetical protein [Streptomyces sp. TRM 70361]MEE1937912.1 hypothetical protein [Streptomyces sp. TRM 70361]
MRGHLPIAVTACLLLAGATGCGGQEGGGAPRASKAAGTNGVAELGPRRIAERAGAVLADAPSLRAVVRTPDVGTADLAADDRGNCAGTMFGGGDGGDGAARLVRRGGTVWVRPNDAYWEFLGEAGDSARAKRELLDGRYIRGPADPEKAVYGQVALLCDLILITGELIAAVLESDTLAKGSPTEVGGVRAVPVTGTSEGGATTLFVALDGEPRPVRLTREGGGGTETYELRDYGRPVPEGVPSRGESLDEAELLGADGPAPAA